MATSKHILVVDDDSYVRESTEEILRRRGYEVDTAADGNTDTTKARCEGRAATDKRQVREG